MDTWFLLFTLLAGLVIMTIVYWLYWFLKKIRALIRLLWTSIFGRSVTKNSRHSSTYNSPYAAAGKFGLAVVIANQYEGVEKLNGTAKDKERWEKTFKYLNFDVMTSEKVGLNANRDEMLRLCELLQEITIRPKDVPNYRYIAFVFSGHGYKDANNNDVIVSQDGKSLSLVSEVFPCLFGGRRGDCIKLIFIDACRSDPSQEELDLTKLHVKKAIKRSNPTVHVAPDLSTTKDNIFIAFATLMGLPAEDTSQGSLFSSSFTKWLRKDISLVSAMAEVTEEVTNSPTLHDFEFRPMSVNMLSCKVNLYKSAGKGWVSSVKECFETLASWIKPDTDTQDPHPNQGPIPDPVPNQDQIPDPNANQDHIQDPDPNLGQISDSASSTDADTRSETGGSGDNGQGNSYLEPDFPHDNLSTNEDIQIPPPGPDGGVNQSPFQAGDPSVDGSQQNSSTDSATDDVQLVIRSEAETSPSTLQPPSSRHPPSSPSQTADRTERDEDLDGPAAPDQLSDTDHGMDSHVLKSPIQASQDSPHQSPEPRGHHSMVLPPLQVSHKPQAPPVPENPDNVQQEENVPGSPPVADEQSQRIQAGGQNNRYQVVSEGAGLRRNMGEGPQVPSDDKNMEGISPVLPFNRAESAPAPDHHSNNPYVPQSTTISSQGPHPSPSGPAEVHDPSTTVQGHTHPVLDSTPSESEINEKVGSKMSSDWDQFAIQLSFGGNTRRKIRKNNQGNCDDCFSNVVCLWLERSAGSKDLPRTWRTVLEAVRKSGHWGLADDVRKSLLAASGHTED